jgi:small subunit ribosomal protein S5
MIKEQDKKSSSNQPSQNRGRGSSSGGSDSSRPSRRRDQSGRDDRDDGFEQKLIDLARVTRVMAGGKRMRFRACVVIGDGKGKVGTGLAKGADVQMAISKAVTQAKKNLITIPIYRGSIAHIVREKYKAAQVLIKPAPQGTGIIAGGPVRAVLQIVGIPNVVAKMLGSNNKVNNVNATLRALSRLHKIVDKPKSAVVDEPKEVSKEDAK